ncbi:hypothetical protein [Actinotalea sp. C106]|uniref:hypothetical protein n=1 Tax=Actinotalea sp. C106 TaxID=2908644 RepID=UPI00202947BD|nr:hypothetical protein [Actinotalea sp. C106]
MDLWTLVRTTLRRWYVALPIVVGAAVFGYTLAEDLPPVYVATSSAILTGPEIVDGTEEGETVDVNPYLQLGGSLTTTTQVLVVLMDSTPARFKYEELGLEPDYEVTRADAVMFFDVEGSDPDNVVETANRLVELADTELADLQGEISSAPELRAQAVPLSVPQVADEDTGGGLTLMAVVGVVGLVLGVVAAVALDGVLLWRRRRREGDATEGNATEDTVGSDDTERTAEPEVPSEAARSDEDGGEESTAEEHTTRAWAPAEEEVGDDEGDQPRGLHREPTPSGEELDAEDPETVREPAGHRTT